ncbi:hypothetical protein F5Y04DRAFT_260992 [Hypomontagnella monticulosa]|nr:hypothetical protein F5Y04DRAFT_260992 [Hypomontagnella monticulosa]
MDMTGATISSESYEKFARSSRSQASNERVQEMMDSGLMSRDAVYWRYTKLLSYNQRSKNRESSGLWKMGQAFRRLRDAETGYLSETKFNLMVIEKLPQLGPPASPDGLKLLFDIFSWHAFFPFPELHTDTGIPCIDENAFIRAACLLARNPAPRYAPEFSNTTHDFSTGYWGPNLGWLITKRGKDGSDFLRRLFRSLAVYNGTGVGNRTKIMVPRAFISHHVEDAPDGLYGLDSGLYEDYKYEVIVEKEDELSVDIQDTLAECSPSNNNRLTASPLRESYELVLPSLPHHEHDLANLHVPTTKLVTFFHFLQDLHSNEGRAYYEDSGEEEEESDEDPFLDLIASAERLSNEGRLDWGQFDTVMSEEAEYIAYNLSDIVQIFGVPFIELLSGG